MMSTILNKIKRTKMKIVPFLAMIVVITGCSNTVSTLKSSNDALDGVIISSESLSTTYRHLRTAARQCLEHQPLGTPVTVESEFDTEFKEGQIRQRMSGQGVLLITTVIDVSSDEKGNSVVTLYTLKGLSSAGVKAPAVEDIKRWISGDARCTTSP